jgi:transposase
MRQKPAGRPSSSERTINDIKRKTRKQYSAEEKIRIVLDGLRGEDSIAELCRREGIAQGLHYKWSKDFMEAGKKRLAGDIVRQPIRAKSPHCVVKLENSRKLSRNKPWNCVCSKKA